MPASRKKGLILLCVFFLLLTITTLLLVMFEMQQRDSKLLLDYEWEVKARWLSYGGIACAMQRLNENPAFRGDFETDISPGKIQIQIKNSMNGIKITSTGIFQTVKVETTKEMPNQENEILFQNKTPR